jgi:cytochrome c-L
MRGQARQPMRRRWRAAGVAMALLLGGLAAGGARAAIELLDPLTNEPLALDKRPDQTTTPAVEEFLETGKNPYAGDEAAIAAGKKLYARWCQACHLADGSGRIGPRLNDDQWKYPRAATDQGKFEIIYAGGAGAMQAFGDRLDHDEILELVAFLDTLAKP